MCTILSIGNAIWEYQEGNSFIAFLPRPDGANASLSAFLTFWSYVIILNTVVPISLYVRSVIKCKTSGHLQTDETELKRLFVLKSFFRTVWRYFVWGTVILLTGIVKCTMWRVTHQPRPGRPLWTRSWVRSNISSLIRQELWPRTSWLLTGALSMGSHMVSI